MNDTSPQIEKLHHDMLMARSPLERLKMSCSMYDTAKHLVIASIKEQDPDCSPQKMRQEIFMRFYGDDYNAAQKKKILTWLGSKNGNE